MKLSPRQMIVVLTLALLGWALCGAIMFVGLSVATLETTLVVHALGAPLIFSTIAWFYFTKLNYTAPLQTAAIFMLTVIFMDFFLVALVINRSLAMFQSLLGTWIPFGLLSLHLSDGMGGGRAKQATEISVAGVDGGRLHRRLEQSYAQFAA